MDFEHGPRSKELQARLHAFMDEHVYPNEEIYAEQSLAQDDIYDQPPIMEQLQKEARSRDLWNLFLPRDLFADGLSNVDYAPLAEIIGRSYIAPEATNAFAPNTSNMEMLAEFGTKQQKERWLEPLLAGEIRSCFAITEPDVAGSDVTTLASSIVRDGDEYVVNGHKWWTTGAADPRCKICLFMGVSETEGEQYARQSLVLIPLDTPGVKIVRSLPVFGFDAGPGHGEIVFDDVRIPAENLIGTEGGGLAVAGARLGTSRIHHCMRAIGMAERALDLTCRRAETRVAFGMPLSKQGVIRDWVAEARIRIEQARLLTLHAARLLDTVGVDRARTELSAIKLVTADLATFVIDRAIQVHGGAGVSNDFPLARMYVQARTFHIADGADETHKLEIARRELSRWKAG